MFEKQLAHIFIKDYCEQHKRILSNAELQKHCFLLTCVLFNLLPTEFNEQHLLSSPWYKSSLGPFNIDIYHLDIKHLANVPLSQTEQQLRNRILSSIPHQYQVLLNANSWQLKHKCVHHPSMSKYRLAIESGRRIKYSYDEVRDHIRIVNRL